MDEKPDFFNINPDVPKAKKEESLEDRFSRERLEWSEKIAEMGLKVTKIMEIPELMTTLYTERQRAIEYYHYLISLLIGVGREYRKEYAAKHDFYTLKSQIRYPNETTKHNRILVDLANLVEKKETLENHAKFMNATTGTIDNIVYAIQRRIEIENIAQGR